MTKIIPSVDIVRIRLDGNTQSRAKLDWSTIEEYADAMREGAEFPPVVVFNDGVDLWLADGFHRIYAARSIALTTINAEIRGGTKRDAVLHSVGANSSHGLRRTNADKRAAVLRLLDDDEWRQWSDREIARRCGVTHPFVSGLRLSGNDYQIDTQRKATRNGVTYTVNTEKIGKPEDPSPAVEPDEEAAPTMLYLAEQLTKLIRGSTHSPGMGLIILDDLIQQKQGWYHDLVRCYVPETAKPEALAVAASMVLDEVYGKRDGDTDANWAAGAVSLDRDWTDQELDDYAEANAVLVDDALPAEADQLPIEPTVLRPVSLRPDYDGDEWYTPPEVVAAVRDVLGEINLDPATCKLANEVVKAGHTFCREEDGLTRKWYGRVYLNPPYSDPAAWVFKLEDEYKHGRVTAAIVLVNNATETTWFQALLRFPVCFPARRMQFWRHDHSGIGARQGQAIFYLGPNKAAFVERFSAQFGPVLEAIT